MILAVTHEALSIPFEPRFYRTERGYQGRLYSALQERFNKRGVVDGRTILELEYQKSPHHGTTQRPDVVLHVPAEHSGASVRSNNFAVWALKRKASEGDALADFDKLDLMFSQLDYRIGIFVNIGIDRHFLDRYRGGYSERLLAVGVQRTPNGICVAESRGWT